MGSLLSSLSWLPYPNRVMAAALQLHLQQEKVPLPASGSLAGGTAAPGGAVGVVDGGGGGPPAIGPGAAAAAGAEAAGWAANFPPLGGDGMSSAMSAGAEGAPVADAVPPTATAPVPAPPAAACTAATRAASAAAEARARAGRGWMPRRPFSPPGRHPQGYPQGGGGNRCCRCPWPAVPGPD